MMKLSKQDADLFFELMWALQYFINQKLRILPAVRTLKSYIACSAEDRLKVRNPLYEQRELIDAFIEENPQQLSKEKLEIVKTWKQCITGDFYIERILKKYTIFIASDNTVYAVLALYDAFDEMFYKGQLPLLVKAVLLPFKGKIIYDGILQGYNMFFGSGITGSLKETYLRAKQNDRIIESLDARTVQAATRQAKKTFKDWKPEFEKLIAQAKKLKGGGEQPAIYNPIFSLVKASLELGQSAASDPDDVDQLWRYFKKVERTLQKVETTLYRLER